MELRIRELRRERNISQKQLADAVGSNQQSITDWELYKKEPRLEALIAIADFFGVSVDYLIGRSDVPYFVRSYTIKDGTVICFTTEKPSGDCAEGQEDERAVSVTLDPHKLPTNRRELEHLVEQLIHKVVSEPKE